MNLGEAIVVAVILYIFWFMYGVAVMLVKDPIYPPCKERDLGPVGKVLAAAFLATSAALDWLAENYGWLIYQEPEHERGDTR